MHKRIHSSLGCFTSVDFEGKRRSTHELIAVLTKDRSKPSNFFWREHDYHSRAAIRFLAIQFMGLQSKQSGAQQQNLQNGRRAICLK